MAPINDTSKAWHAEVDHFLLSESQPKNTRTALMSTWI